MSGWLSYPGELEYVPEDEDRERGFAPMIRGGSILDEESYDILYDEPTCDCPACSDPEGEVRR